MSDSEDPGTPNFPSGDLYRDYHSICQGLVNSCRDKYELPNWRVCSRLAEKALRKADEWSSIVAIKWIVDAGILPSQAIFACKASVRYFTEHRSGISKFDMTAELAKLRIGRKFALKTFTAWDGKAKDWYPSFVDNHRFFGNFNIANILLSLLPELLSLSHQDKIAVLASAELLTTSVRMPYLAMESAKMSSLLPGWVHAVPSMIENQIVSCENPTQAFDGLSSLVKLRVRTNLWVGPWRNACERALYLLRALDNGQVISSHQHESAKLVFHVLFSYFNSRFDELKEIAKAGDQMDSSLDGLKIITQSVEDLIEGLEDEVNFVLKFMAKIHTLLAAAIRDSDKELSNRIESLLKNGIGSVDVFVSRLRDQALLASLSLSADPQDDDEFEREVGSFALPFTTSLQQTRDAVCAAIDAIPGTKPTGGGQDPRALATVNIGAVIVQQNLSPAAHRGTMARNARRSVRHRPQRQATGPVQHIQVAQQAQPQQMAAVTANQGVPVDPDAMETD